MQAVLPPALEAILRMGRYPNDSEMVSEGMPIGVPFSNQSPYTPRGPMMDPSLSALTTMLSGLGAPMGAEPPMQEDPRTMFIRPSISPSMAAGGEAPRRHVSGMSQPGQEQAMLQQIVDRGGTTLPQSVIQGYQARAAKTGQGMGIGDPERYAAWKQGMADDEAVRRGLVNDRAMQVAQARTNRQSGMDPRTAALLAALGDDAGGMGGVVLGNALSPGFGAKAYELGVEERVRDKTNQAAIEKEKISAGIAPGGAAAKIPDAATGIVGGKRADIESARPSASNRESAIRDEAAKIYDRHVKSGLDPQRAASVTARELIDAHGVPEQEAVAIASLFSEQPPLPRKPMTKMESGRKSPLSAEKTFEEDPVGWLTGWMVKNTPLPNFLGYP
jgi:hypothetical protein